jgi:hypothetical protein
VFPITAGVQADNFGQLLFGRLQFVVWGQGTSSQTAKMQHEVVPQNLKCQETLRKASAVYLFCAYKPIINIQQKQ